jgi:type VI secretion system (T6SS) effector TldE1-like protein
LLKVASGWMAAVVAAALIALAIVSGDMPARSSAAIAPGPSPDRTTTGSHVILASLETDAAAPDAAAAEPMTTVTKTPVRGSSFFDRFNSSFGDLAASFGERFGVAATDANADAAPAARQPSRALASSDPARDAAPEKISKPVRLAMLTPSTGDPQIPASPNRPVDAGNRTAVYDISARVVYLPNGEKLEAHSGLGHHMDDVRTIALKNKGVTPPNVYDLSERESLFHGVRAIRMRPSDPDKMFGREGILVHPYMLGANGESNGCVSVKDYPKFLRAFLNGEIDRLVVVERLDDTPDNKSFADRIKSFFKSS